MEPQTSRTWRLRTVAAAAAIGLALAAAPATFAAAAPTAETVRSFDTEALGAPPTGCVSVGDVTIADASFGGAGESNRALRLNDQTTTAQTRTQCTYPTAAERSVS